MKRAKVIVSAAACVLALCAAAIAAPWLVDWLDVTTFQGRVGDPALVKDGFVVKGSFNMTPNALDPSAADVTVHVGDWAVAFDGASWTKKGKTERYVATSGDVRMQIDYWVAGSSKCKFTLIAAKQVMTDKVPDFPYIPIEVEVGAAYDVTFWTKVVLKGAGFKMVPDDAGMFCAIRTLSVSHSDKKPGRDGFSGTAFMHFEETFDPATMDVTVAAAGYTAVIPAGSLTLLPDGSVKKYTGILPGGGMVTFSLKASTRVVTFSVKNVTLPGYGSETVGRLAITGIVGADWPMYLYLAANPAGTNYKY